MKHNCQKIINWLLDPHSKGFFERKNKNINRSSLTVNKQKRKIDIVILCERLTFQKAITTNVNRFLLICGISIFIALLVSVGATIYIALQYQDRDQRIKVYDEMSKVASTFSAICISATFVLTGLKYAQESHLNRKKSGHDYLVNTFLGRVSDLRDKLDNKVDPYFIRNQSY